MSKRMNQKPHGKLDGQSGAQNNHGASMTRTDATKPNNKPPERMKQTPAQNLVQLRAKHALEQIDKIIKHDDEIKKNKSDEEKKLNDDGHLSSHIAGFPAMILMSGFGQACAFYLSKGGTMKLAYDALEDWLTTGNRPYSNAVQNKYKLMTAITSGDAATYRLAQAEALVYLDWLKKFAKAFLKNDDGNSGGEQGVTT